VADVNWIHLVQVNGSLASCCECDNEYFLSVKPCVFINNNIIIIFTIINYYYYFYKL